MREFLVEAVSLAAIGTIADVVPLLDENRILVRHGLSILPERASCGLKAIFETAEISGRKSIEAEDIGFAVAPRLNAAGRLGQARLAVELLTTENPERAAVLSEYLNGLNRERQTVERRIFKQAKELVAKNPEWSEHPAFVLAHRDWHAGVIGIVASRVAEHYERPTILISLGREDGVGQGSGRSFAGFDLHAGLAACSDQLLTFGGHSAAAGLKIHRDRIDDFRDCFRQFVVENHDVSDRDLEQKIDAEIRLADLTHQTVKQIDRLGPFGQGNRRPVFSTSKVELVEPPKKMGQGERHLSLRVRHYGHVMRAIAFGKADWADQMIKVDGPISICFSPKINRFRGYESVELELIDWNSWNSPSETPSVQNIPTTIKEN
jgi:single-stranded-DNA-specific exonuclease